MSSNFFLATLATRECAEELQLLHASLRAFHPAEEVPLVVGCSSDLMRHLDADRAEGKSKSQQQQQHIVDDAGVKFIPCLDQYGAIRRREMERTAGVWYPTRHCDFMMEKANVMDWALQNLRPATSSSSSSTAAPRFPDGVLFVDSDITFLAPLQQMFAAGGSAPLVGVSPHEIQPRDEQLFGKFNGGMLFAAHPVVLWHWRRATHASRYFDQASIEDVVTEISATEGADAVLRFPPQVNYGFWRMFQAPRPVDEEARRFSVSPSLGIEYLGRPLQSVHTHFFMPTPCREIPVFNALLKKWVGEVRQANPAMYRGLLKLML